MRPEQYRMLAIRGAGEFRQHVTALLTKAYTCRSMQIPCAERLQVDFRLNDSRFQLFVVVFMLLGVFRPLVRHLACAQSRVTEETCMPGGSNGFTYTLSALKFCRLLGESAPNASPSP